jgi:Domain of unknown function (DUF4388)
MTAPLAQDARDAVIEGSLREVALADVLQLLDLSRKSGVVRVSDGAGLRRASVTVVAGRVTDAELAVDGLAPCSARDAVIELLGWSSGRFVVEPLPDEMPARPGFGAMAVESLLMEAARRADEWARLADRVSGPDAVPRLAPPTASTRAPLALAPDEWAVLAYADGRADLRMLAARLGRDTLVVAAAVHRLVGEGLLALDGGGVPEALDVPDVPDVPTDDRRSSLI